MITNKYNYNCYTVPVSFFGSFIINLFLFILLGLILASVTIETPQSVPLVLVGIRHISSSKAVPQASSQPAKQTRPSTARPAPESVKKIDIAAAEPLASTPPAAPAPAVQEVIETKIPVINIPSASPFQISQRNVNPSQFTLANKTDQRELEKEESARAVQPEGSIKVKLDETDITLPDAEVSLNAENITVGVVKSDIFFENYSFQPDEMPEISQGTGAEGKVVQDRRVISAPLPEAPEWIERRGIMPAVICKVVINPSGGVDNVSFEQRSGYAEFDALIAEYLRKWKFESANYYSSKTIKLRVRLLR